MIDPGLTAPPLPPGCPWSDFTPPNLDWCELERCAWVVNPFGTWSNALYLVLGVAMIAEARRRDSRALALFGPASLFVGVCSAVYHASYTWLLQFFDYLGMFVFCFLVIAVNARRLGWIAPQRQTALFLAGVGIFSALVPALFYVGVPIQGLVGLLILAILGQEAAARARFGPHPAYPLFGLALALLAAAGLASLLDITRIWCVPASWLQGHAIWHVLSAAALFALFRFYAGLERQGGFA